MKSFPVTIVLYFSKSKDNFFANPDRVAPIYLNNQLFKLVEHDKHSGTNILIETFQNLLTRFTRKVIMFLTISVYLTMKPLKFDILRRLYCVHLFNQIVMSFGKYSKRIVTSLKLHGVKVYFVFGTCSSEYTMR